MSINNLSQTTQPTTISPHNNSKPAFKGLMLRDADKWQKAEPKLYDAFMDSKTINQFCKKYDVVAYFEEAKNQIVMRVARLHAGLMEVLAKGGISTMKLDGKGFTSVLDEIKLLDKAQGNAGMEFLETLLKYQKYVK